MVIEEVTRKHKFSNNDELKGAVKDWLEDDGKAKKKYGDISKWDVSEVTSMKELFKGATDFNGDLSSWDISSVTNMQKMFWHASSFDGDLSRWDTSSVTIMGFMFNEASSFNGDLSSWDTSSVTNMSVMFDGASKFDIACTKNWAIKSECYKGW